MTIESMPRTLPTVWLRVHFRSMRKLCIVWYCTTFPSFYASFTSYSIPYAGDWDSFHPFSVRRKLSCSRPWEISFCQCFSLSAAPGFSGGGCCSPICQSHCICMPSIDSNSTPMHLAPGKLGEKGRSGWNRTTKKGAKRVKTVGEAKLTFNSCICTQYVACEHCDKVRTNFFLSF